MEPQRITSSIFQSFAKQFVERSNSATAKRRNLIITDLHHKIQFYGVLGAKPLGEGVAEDTANAIRDCRGPLQGPRNDNVVPWLKRGEGFPLCIIRTRFFDFALRAPLRMTRLAPNAVLQGDNRANLVCRNASQMLHLRAPPDVVFLGNRARTAHKKDYLCLKSNSLSPMAPYVP